MSLPIFPNSSKISFDEFVSNNRDSIRKTYFTKFYKNVISINGNKVKVVEEVLINDKDLKKWYPIIDSANPYFNMDKYTKNLISIYLEVLYTYKKSYDNTLPTSSYDVNIENEIKELFEKIVPNKRSKIVDKYYNYTTGTTEYLLEDGNYVPINENIGKAEIIITKDMLPKQILSIIDIQEYRNQQINKII